MCGCLVYSPAAVLVIDILKIALGVGLGIGIGLFIYWLVVMFDDWKRRS